MQMKKMKWIAVVVMAAMLFASTSCGSDSSQEDSKTNNSDVSSELQEGSDTQENLNETGQDSGIESQAEDNFLYHLKSVAGDTVAEEAYGILVNQIGFSSLEFEGQMGETQNYEIVADGTYMVLTAMEGYYRVFIPDTSYIFYEDNEVKMTASELADKKIGSDEQITYYIIAQEIVSNCLKNPGSADFPSISLSPSDIAIQKSGDTVAVQSYVDAENSLGAVVRSQWIVEFKVIDMSSFSYETIYINLDGETSGEFIDLN